MPFYTIFHPVSYTHLIDLKRTINVLIANFKIDILKNLEFHTQWKIIEEKGRKTVLTDDLELHIIELPKMRKNKATGKDKKLLEWLRCV